MDFDSFLTHINQLENLPLGGEVSQLKLAPELRKQYPDDLIVKRNPSDAAVLVLCYPNDQGKTQLLLMLRASYDGTHSAQISFPGGKQDQEDQSLFQTAIRETEEEMGIDREDIVLIRPVTKTYIPPSNFWVHPFLSYIDYQPKLVPNQEVESVVEVDLETILSDNSLTKKTLSTSYMDKIDVPCFKLNGYIVWGATAMVLSEIKDLFKSII